MPVDRFLDLGELEMVVDAERRSPGGHRPARLLAALLINVNRRVGPDTLLDAVWEDNEDGRRATLATHVWRLRRVLEPQRAGRQPPSVLVNDAGGYRLVAAIETVDSLRFEQLAAEADQLLRTGQPERALRRAEEALSLWRGRPIEVVADRAWAAPVVAKFTTLRSHVQHRQIAAWLALGQHRQALAALDVLLAEEPLDESLWAQRMLAEYRSGRMDAALRSYQEVRQRLDDDLGVPPGAALQDLQLRILNQDRDLLAAARPTISVQVDAVTQVHLPAARGRVIGRTADVSRLAELLQIHSLTTVVGAAGCGKTTVAVATARNLADTFVDGIWFVDLTSAKGPEQVLGTFASSLQVAIPPTGSVHEAVRSFTQRRRMLLVVDNAEHVLEATAELLTTLLAEAELTVLVTSREPLLLPAEQEYQLQPLALPGTDPPGTDVAGELRSPAVELFLDRLPPGRVPDARQTDQLALIEQICVTVDGLPLAIELAAARHRAFSLTEIADQVRLDPSTLQALGRGGPDHHRTLRSAIDWSYRLLTPAEQGLHRQLAVVPGATTAAAAAALTGRSAADVEGLLASLAHRSLLTPRLAENRIGVTRFSQLATVRAHAEHQLSDTERAAAQSRLDSFVHDLLVSRGRRGRPEEAAWMESLDDNLDALRASFRHNLIDQPAPVGVDLFTRVGIYWYFRGRMVESRSWIPWTARLFDSITPLLRALMELGMGSGYCWRSRGDLARAPVRAALQRTDNGDADSSIRWGEQLAIVSYGVWAADEAELGREMARRLQRVARTTDDTDLAALATGSSILAGAMNDRPADVLDRADAAHDRIVEVDNVLARWFVADGATAAAVAAGDAEAGRLWSDRAAAACLRLRISEGSILFEQRANVLALSQDFELAAQLYAGAQLHQRRNGLTAWNLAETADLFEQTRAGLGPDAFEQAWAQGPSVTLQNALHPDRTITDDDRQPNPP